MLSIDICILVLSIDIYILVLSIRIQGVDAVLLIRL